MTAQSDRGYCYHTLFLFSLLVFAAFSVAYHKKQFLGRYPPPLPTANRLCRLRYENINGDGDAKASTPFFCAMPKHLQFDKFIWLLSDGLPRGMVDDTFHHYGDHSVRYNVYCPGIRYSHAMYTSFWSGAGPTNYNAIPVREFGGETVFDAMLRANTTTEDSLEYHLRYLGPEWCPLKLLGEDHVQILFEETDRVEENYTSNLWHTYPTLFESEDDEAFLKYMDEISQKNQSVVMHSAVFDHINHSNSGLWPKKNTHADRRKKGALEKGAEAANQDMQAFKSFIDTHPDYLLILSSDHGVDEAVPPALHGFARDGNEAFLLFYNPKLSPGHHEQRIDIVDVAVTVAKYLRGVDIPANSLGTAQNYYGSSRTAIMTRLYALLQNCHQTVHLMSERGYNMDTAPLNIIMEAIRGPSPSLQALEQYVEDLEGYAESLKDSVYRSPFSLPTWNLAFFLIICCACVIFSIIQHNPALCRFIRFVISSQRNGDHYRNSNIDTVYELQHDDRRRLLWFVTRYIFLLVLCWAGVWMPVLLANHDATNWLYRGPGIHFIWGPLLVCILFYVYRMHGESTGAVSELRLILLLLVGNESINFAAYYTVSITTSYNLFWLWMEIPFPRELSFLCWLVALHIYRTKLVHDLTDRLNASRRRLCNVVAGLGAAVLISMYIYCITQDNDAWYITPNGFHICGFIAYGSIALLFLVSAGCYAYHSKFSSPLVLVPINALLVLVWSQTPFSLLYLLLLNVQLQVLVGPSLQRAGAIWANSAKPCSAPRQISSSSSRAFSDLTRGQCATAIVLQVAVLYAMAQFFFVFRAVLNEQFNLNVFPPAARIGIRSDSVFPTISGLMMIVHKFAPLLLLPFFFLSLPKAVFYSKLYHVSLVPLRGSSALIKDTIQWKTISKILSVALTALYFHSCASHVGYCVILYVYANHLRDESFMMHLIVSALFLLLALGYLVARFSAKRTHALGGTPRKMDAEDNEYVWS